MIICVLSVLFLSQEEENAVEIKKSIINEVNDLAKKGYKEITLLGQNVDSYLWFGGGLKKTFIEANPLQQKTAVNFSMLLDLVASGTT